MLLSISGFHRAFFKVNHFYWPTNAPNCIKFKGYNLRCINFKRQLKITPTCFGSFAIHNQGVLKVLD